MPPEHEEPAFENDRLWNFVNNKYFVCEEKFEEFFVNGSVNEEIRMDVFRQLYARVDPKKSPGSPMVFMTSTNEGLDDHLAEIKEVVEYRIARMREIGKNVWESRCFSSTEEEHVVNAVSLLRAGIKDPVLIGFKGEPRKVGKMPRLVGQVSVIDNLTERFLYGDHLVEEQTHTNIPTATQLDIVTPERTEERRRKYAAKGKLASSDIQHWEYSNTENDAWVACYKGLICMNLIGRNPDGTWYIKEGKHEQVYAQVGFHFTVIHRVVQTPNGKLLVVRAGQMSSGRLKTFSDNSIVRAFLSENVSFDLTGHSIDFVETGGDDCLDSNLFEDAAHAWAVYIRYGKKVTDYQEEDGIYHFCSTEFNPDGSFQENIDKSVYAILSRRQFNPEDQMAFSMCFKHHSAYQEKLSLIAEYINDASGAEANN